MLRHYLNTTVLGTKNGGKNPMTKLFNSFMEQFKGWNTFEKGLGVLAVIGSIVLTILWADTLFGLSVTLTGVLCVVLVSKRNSWNYFWGTYNVIGYAYLAYTWGLGGDFMLNAFYFLPMQFVGIAMWKRNLESGAIVKARDFKLKGYIWLTVGTVLAVFAYSFILKDVVAPYFASTRFYFATYDNYAFYLFDSMSTVLSVIAMWLMAKRYAAQWGLWIVVNIASISMWSIAWALNTEIGGFAASGAPAMVLMWTMYLVNAIYGYITWVRASKNA